MEVVVCEKSYPYRGEAVDVFEAFRDRAAPFLLDSSLRRPARGRFSFIGFDPFQVIADRGERSLARLKKKFCRFAQPPAAKAFPFTGGIVGFLGYDFGLSLEPAVKPRPRPDEGLSSVPGYFFGFYDAAIVLDHGTGRLSILSTGLPEKNGSLRRVRARERLHQIARRLGEVSPGRRMPPASYPKPVVPGRESFFTSNFIKADYLKAVAKALDYIRRGDIYQVNLSQRFCFDGGRAPNAPDPWTLYRTLRRLSPSCFGGYLDGGDFQVVSSSPERFLRVDGGVVQTRPMKGTRPRGRTKTEDRRNEKELWASRKDMAELLMITDLERNDLGRVCRAGSVRVKEIRALEKYATVFQTTSTVEGVLENGRDAFDCLQASFPGGSVTGCPKIRAMQVIDELEPSPRSIYTGGMGYIGFDGKMDFNILIRTFLAHGKKFYFHAGGGIVADSVPEREYEETLVKARAMKDCLGLLLRDGTHG